MTVNLSVNSNDDECCSGKERYDYTHGFAKQVHKTPARLDLSELPNGFGFQLEIKLTDTTENKSKPILDKVLPSKQNAENES